MQAREVESDFRDDGERDGWQGQVQEEIAAALLGQDRERLAQATIAGTVMLTSALTGAVIAAALLAGDRPSDEAAGAATVALVGLPLALLCAALGLTFGRYRGNRSVAQMEALHPTWEPKYGGAALLALQRDLHEANQRVLDWRSRAIVAAVTFLVIGILAVASAGVALVWL